MNYEIVSLQKEKWTGYELKFSYETTGYYELSMVSLPNEMNITFAKKRFDETITKSFTDKLFAPHYENTEAYGVVDGDELLAVIALSKEEWNNRLRITEILVNKNLRGRGIGKRLMDIAKRRANEFKCRALILETQSCNEKAIDFYFSQGFSLFGFDSNCYSNDDIAKKEVRLELGMIVDKIS